MSMFGIILPFSVRYKQQCLIQWHQVSNFRCVFCFALHRRIDKRNSSNIFLSFKFLSGFSLEIFPPNSFEYYFHLQLLMKSLWNWRFGISAFRRTWKVKRTEVKEKQKIIGIESRPLLIITITCQITVNGSYIWYCNFMNYIFNLEYYIISLGSHLCCIFHDFSLGTHWSSLNTIKWMHKNELWIH